MIELLYFYQLPEEACKRYSHFTQNELIEKVWYSIANGERFDECQFVEDILHDKYQCKNIGQFARYLPF